MGVTRLSSERHKEEIRTRTTPLPLAAIISPFLVSRTSRKGLVHSSAKETAVDLSIRTFYTPAQCVQHAAKWENKTSAVERNETENREEKTTTNNERILAGFSVLTTRLKMKMCRASSFFFFFSLLDVWQCPPKSTAPPTLASLCR